MRIEAKTIFKYDFRLFQLQPILETQWMVIEDDVLRSFDQQNVLTEKPIKEMEKKEVTVALAPAPLRESAEASKAEAVPLEKEQRATRSYTLTYYNPETQKTEVFEAKTDVRVKDFVKQMVEEAAGAATTYPVYSFVTSPLVTKQVEPHLLQKILDEREYGTPPRFGGVAVVKIAAPSSKIVAVEKAEKARGALIESLHRKEEVEAEIEQEILALEQVAEALTKEKPAKALKKLGPLSRARFLLALKEKKLPPRIILLLIERDIRFLRAMKKKLQTLTLEDLLGLVRAMKQLKTR